MSENYSEKTEEPTPKKRQDAFKEGNFAKSAEVGVFFILFAAFLGLSYGMKAPVIKITQLASSTFSNLNTAELSQAGVIQLLNDHILSYSYMVGPILAICLIGAIIGGGIQSGFKIAIGTLSIKWDRVNPANGFSRIFSGWGILGIEVLKFSLVGVLLYFSLKKLLGHPLFFSPLSLNSVALFIFDSFVSILGRLVALLGFIAALSYIYQWFRTQKSLRMTRQELKDEHRQSMGDPLVKAARKRLAFQLLQKQMINKVPVADVIITNPTHYAIALKYEREKDVAPVVLAKGKNLFAQKIKDIAKSYEVPIVENKPTARLLYKVGKVGQSIPADLYRVVAEILAYVYRTHKYYFYRLKARRQDFGEPENSLKKQTIKQHD